MQINGQSKYTSCGNRYIFQWQKVYKSNISLEWNCQSCRQDWRVSSGFARLRVTRPNINFLSNATSVPYLHLLDEERGYWWAFYVTSTSIHQTKFARLSRKKRSGFLLLFFLYRSDADDWPLRISAAVKRDPSEYVNVGSSDISSFVQGNWMAFSN